MESLKVELARVLDAHSRTPKALPRHSSLPVFPIYVQEAAELNPRQSFEATSSIPNSMVRNQSEPTKFPKPCPPPKKKFSAPPIIEKPDDHDNHSGYVVPLSHSTLPEDTATYRTVQPQQLSMTKEYAMKWLLLQVMGLTSVTFCFKYL